MSTRILRFSALLAFTLLFAITLRRRHQTALRVAIAGLVHGHADGFFSHSLNRTDIQIVGSRRTGPRALRSLRRKIPSRRFALSRRSRRSSPRHQTASGPRLHLYLRSPQSRRTLRALRNSGNDGKTAGRLPTKTRKPSPRRPRRKNPSARQLRNLLVPKQPRRLRICCTPAPSAMFAKSWSMMDTRARRKSMSTRNFSNGSPTPNSTAAEHSSISAATAPI